MQLLSLHQNGYALVYPKREDLEFKQGKDTMKSYRMGAKVHKHVSCPECSASVTIDLDPEAAKKCGMQDNVAMNVSIWNVEKCQSGANASAKVPLLKDIDMNANTLNGMPLESKQLPGRTFGTAYEAPDWL